MEEENVRFIRITFFDAFGRQRNIAIMPSELARAMNQGISFDADAIPGLSKKGGSDLFLKPDISTFSIVPWRPVDGRVCRLFANIYYADGTPFERDSRKLLSDAVKAAAEEGLSVSIGPEMEFYVFKKDENGEPTRIPVDHAGYMDVGPLDRGEDLRRDICFTLVDMGMTPESSHHEQGPGQNEIDIRFSDPLAAADNCATLKWAITCLANMDGLWADISPKPLKGEPGSGMHVNMSVESKDGRDVNMYFMSGILNRIRELTLFLNPTVNSFDRFGKSEAPSRVCFGNGEREALIRIPDDKGVRKRFELRSPDACANPYLAFALLIYAGLEGVKNGEEFPYTMRDGIVYKDGQTTSDCPLLPQDMKGAKELAGSSDFVKKYVPEGFLNVYLDA